MSGKNWFKVRIFKIISQIRSYVKTSRHFYLLQLIIRSKFNEGANTNRIIKPDTDICIEGFPRSANSFIIYFLWNINTNLKYVGHTHSVATIKSALLEKISIFV